MDLEKVKKRLDWEHKFDSEFKTRESGYTFVIDVINRQPMVSLYRFSPYITKSEPLEQQPPLDMLNEALADQGNEALKDGVFYINEKIRSWIEENILQAS